MTIEGKIIQVLPLQGGVSKTSGKEWKLQAYVLETQEQYPKKVHFEVFGEDRIKANPCNIDDIVSVDFDIESREFNGRWYTSIRAWKITKKQDETENTQQQEEAQVIIQEVTQPPVIGLLANETSDQDLFDQSNNSNLPF